MSKRKDQERVLLVSSGARRTYAPHQRINQNMWGGRKTADLLRSKARSAVTIQTKDGRNGKGNVNIPRSGESSIE